MKGVETLLAAVLLIGFTVAIAATVSVWFTAVTRDTQSSVTSKSDTAVDCAGAAMGIDQVYVFNNSVARAVIRNKGSVNLSIITAQIFDSQGNNFTSSSLPAAINSGSAISLDFSANLLPCPQTFSRLIVTSSCAQAESVFTGMPLCM